MLTSTFANRTKMRPDALNPRGWMFFSLFILAVTVAGLGCLLSHPGLWLEETAQFFTALGVQRGQVAAVQQQSLSNLVAQSNQHLLDPVGYTLMLYGWQAVSTAATWLRLLPLIGFLGMLATGYRILRYSEVPKAEAVLLISLFAFSPLLYTYATVLRPYSYEAWGTLFALSALYRYTPQKSVWWKFRTGLGMAFFLWMRYPFVVAAVVTGGLIFFKILSRKDQSVWRPFLFYLAPQIVSAVLIYVFCIRLQTIPDQAPDYTRSATLRYGVGFLLNPWTVFYHLSVLAFLAIVPFRERFRYPIHLGRFTLFTVLLFGSWTALSTLGCLPSDPASRWGIGLAAVAMMCLLMLLAVLLAYVPRYYKPWFYMLLAALALTRPALMAWRWHRDGTAGCRGTSVTTSLSQVIFDWPGHRFPGFQPFQKLKTVYALRTLHLQ